MPLVILTAAVTVISATVHAGGPKSNAGSGRLARRRSWRRKADDRHPLTPLQVVQRREHYDAAAPSASRVTSGTSDQDDFNTRQRRTGCWVVGGHDVMCYDCSTCGCATTSPDVWVCVQVCGTSTAASLLPLVPPARRSVSGRRTGTGAIGIRRIAGGRRCPDMSNMYVDDRCARGSCRSTVTTGLRPPAPARRVVVGCHTRAVAVARTATGVRVRHLYTCYKFC